MNKLKTFVISLLIIVAIPFIINYGMFLYLCINNHVHIFKYKVLARENFNVEKFMKEYKFANTEGTEYTKKPSILLFGCGMSEGTGLDEDKTLAKYLSDLSKRTVYNRSVGYGSIQYAIAQVQSHDIDDLIKKSSHAIYFLPSFDDLNKLKVFPGEMMDSNLLLSKMLYLRYIENSDNNLVVFNTKHPVLKGSILYRMYEKQKNKSTDNETMELGVKHLKLLKEELQKVNPEIKVDLIVYYDSPKLKILQLKNEIEQEGINVTFVKDISNINLNEEPKYKFNGNPTGELWKEITPEIVKALKL